MRTDRQALITGIPLIDRQHEEYADLVDRVFELASQGNVSREALSRESSEAIRYAVEHFDAEEHLMRAHEYPAYEEHLAKHNVFRDRIDILSLDIEGDVDLDAYTLTLSKWLIGWFCDQVQTDDRKLAAALHKMGNKQSPGK